ncbi:MAG: patatin-like phospholipase family protein, partial [Gammaproteobacteria bacterium]|nr:patatin-like phospholipase family protein [Gammaproteobacteria bacterium]
NYFCLWQGILSCAILLSFSALPVNATEHILQRPKIGLALSGGGARGAAHIGVLKKLEELRIPVDYIAGTSMGSIIGGLYASGKTADELETLIAGIDWDSAFSDTAPRSQLPMRSKIDDDEFLIDFELGLDSSGIIFPRGVIQGQNLQLILKSLFADSLAVDDFDDLPIPFRAVASDIEAGVPVVLEQGDLATALHASMAIPGVYAPVEIYGKTLVDGGVTNNLPVDVVRAMGADIVIAVDISTPLIRGEDLRSAIDILDQLTNILNQGNVQKQIESLSDKDFFIVPELDKYTSSDFSLVLESIGVGAEAVKPVEDRLQKLALSEADYGAHRERILSRRQQPFVPDYITILQDSAISSDALRDRLASEPAVALDLDRLHRDIERIHGLGIFQSVGYSVRDDYGIRGLLIRAREKSWGPSYLRFGVQLEDDFAGSNTYNLTLGLRRKPVNKLGGELSGLVRGGGEPKLSAEYFQPFSSLADTYGLVDFQNERYDISVFSGNDRVAEYTLRDSEFGAYLGLQYSNFVDLRAGLKRSFGRSYLRIGDEDFPGSADFDDSGLVLEARLDTLDTAIFPSGGSRAFFRYKRHFESLGADLNYTTLEMKGLSVKSFGLFRFKLNYSYATTLGDNTPVQALFRLGGFQNLSGYTQNELGGTHAGLLGIGTYFPVLKNRLSQFERPVYLGLSAEAGNVWQDNPQLSSSELIYSSSVYLGTTTPLGPVYLGFGQAEEGRSSFYFSLGHVF